MSHESGVFVDDLGYIIIDTPHISPNGFPCAAGGVLIYYLHDTYLNGDIDGTCRNCGSRILVKRGTYNDG